MIKRITLLFAAVLAFAVSASADGNLTFNWGHSVEGGKGSGNGVVGMAKSTDGACYVATGFGTTTSAINVKFDGSALTDTDGNTIEGSPYTGTSTNKNLLLQKIDPSTGSVIWNAYTRKGDIDNSNTFIEGSSDGGVVIAVKTRAWVSDAGLDNLIEYVDPTGNATTVKDMWTQSGEYRYLIIKVDADGKLVWTRLVSGLVHDKGDGSYTQASKNNAYVYGLALDADDNIYICGNFRTELYFKDSTGAVVTLTAKNNVGWTGDSQSVIGDLFLAKLDKNGYYTSSLTAEGTASCAFFDKMVYNDGKLYLNGRIKGDGTTMTIGGKEVTASSTLQTEIIASVNTSDLSVNYVNALTSVENAKGSIAIQNKNAQYIDGYVYFTGLVNGGFAKAGETTAFLDNTTSGQLKGYVLKVDPATGEVQTSYVKTDGGIGGYFGVYVAKSSTYAFGYNMSSGAILTRLNNTDYSLNNEDLICKFGTVSLLGNPIIDGENFIMMNRGKGTTTFAESDKQLTTSDWGVVYYSYKIDDTVTAVSNVAAAKNADYDVYTVGGVQMKNGAKSLDEATKSLNKGVYIIGGNKVVVD